MRKSAAIALALLGISMPLINTASAAPQDNTITQQQQIINQKEQEQCY